MGTNRMGGVLGVVVAGLMTMATPKSRAGEGDSKVAPPQARYQGRSYAEWSALQNRWVYSLPAPGHPLIDPGADVGTGQSGDVWFLGGTLAPSEIEPNVFRGEVERRGRIPSGTALFFPMVNVESSTAEGNGTTEAELRTNSRFLADLIVPSSLFLQIDGKPVSGLRRFRTESPLFTIGPLPPNNVFQEIFGVDAPAGSTTPSVGDGYYALVKPLPVGAHKIHFGGILDATSIGGPLFIQDVTYTITVVPRGRYRASKGGKKPLGPREIRRPESSPPEQTGRRPAAPTYPASSRGGSGAEEGGGRRGGEGTADGSLSVPPQPNLDGPGAAGCVRLLGGRTKLAIGDVERGRPFGESDDRETAFGVGPGAAGPRREGPHRFDPGPFDGLAVGAQDDAGHRATRPQDDRRDRLRPSSVAGNG